MEENMPPKVRISKAEIVKTAIGLVRESGEQAINARAIAAALNCSTQPIFSNFSTMEELQDATKRAAYEIYLEFLQKETEGGKYPQYKAYGMAYIRFAKEERELFKLLFMCDRSDKAAKFSSDFTESVKMIMEANNTTYEVAELMHLEMWACVHGIATMLATSFIKLEWDLISDMLSDVYHGLLSRHIKEEK